VHLDFLIPFFSGIFYLSIFFWEGSAFAKNIHPTFEDSQELRIKLSAQEEGEYLKTQSKTWDSCPFDLIERIDGDANVNVRNWYGKKIGNSDDYCTNALSKLVETPDATELSNRLFSHPLTALGNNEKNISERCINLVKDPVGRKFLVAEYYSNMARLRIASVASLESMAAIDSLLGKKGLPDVECPREGMPYVIQACKKLKSCEPRGGLALQAQELQDVYPQYMTLKKEIADLRSANTLSVVNMGPGYTPHREKILEFSAREKKAAENENKVKALESIYPTLKGKEFLKTFDPSKQNFLEAIKNQIKKSRVKVFEQFKEYQEGVYCMRGVGGCAGFDELLYKTPPLNIEHFNRGDELSFEDGQVQAYLGAVECRQNIRKVNENQSEAFKDFVLGTTLALTTIGISAYASYCKAAVSAIENSVFLSTFANRAAVLDAAVNLSQKATVASRTVLGFDLFTLGKNGVGAYNHCSKELNKLSNQKYKKNTSKEDVLCPSQFAQSSSQPQLVANYRSCVAKSIVAGVAGMVIPSNLRENVEGPFKGGIGLVRRGVVTFSQTREKGKEAKNKRSKMLKDSIKLEPASK
jgi:hypothetical protein